MTDQDLAAANEQAWALATEWGGETRMTELETFMWRSERHPQRSSTTSVVMLLDRTPDWGRLYAAHDWASRLVPRMRQRVLEPVAPVGPPAWVVAPGFDLDYHLRRVHLPGAGDTAQLLAFAQGAAMAPFDRTRPLWEGTLVEGLDGGRAAYLLKLHHSLTDGMGGVQLLSLLQSGTREHTPKKAVPEPPPAGRVPDPRTLAVDELTEQVRSVPSAAGRLVAGGAQVLASPGSAAASALRFAGSLRRTLSPPPAGGSPLLRGAPARPGGSGCWSARWTSSRRRPGRPAAR